MASYEYRKIEMTSLSPVNIALVGAGARGELNLATLAKKHPDLIRFVAVAEKDEQRRDSFAKRFNIPRENVFSDWRELFARAKLADGIINALPCRFHYDSGLAGLAAGYHTFLEKPMALTPGQAVKLTRAAKEQNLLLMVALQSRYNKIYSRIRKLFDSGTIGRLMNIDCAENIGYWHFLLAYVRGIHHRADLSHSFLLAKGVHDLDLVNWYAGAPVKKVSSFGSLSYFTEENAPEGAPERCMDDCPHFDTCEFNAYKQFVDPGKPDIPLSLFSGMSLEAVRDYLLNPRFRTLASVITHDISRESVMKTLNETPYGKCVFRSENDLVDHQTVSVEYENGITASFQLSAFSLIWERTLNLHGVKGEIRSADFSGHLECRTYNPAKVKKERIRYHGIVHGGGDETIVVRFAQAIREDDRSNVLTGAKEALKSHLLCFAAEEARQKGEVVQMADFISRAKNEADTL